MFTYADRNYDNRISYNETVAALRKSYNPYTSMFHADSYNATRNGTYNASSDYNSFNSTLNATVPLSNEMSAEDKKLQ